MARSKRSGGEGGGPVAAATGTEFVLYQTEDGLARVQVRLHEGVVWLTQRDLADLYQVTTAAVSQHLRQVFGEGEIDPGATIKRYLTVRTEGNRSVSRLVDHYALPVVLAVGYRVRSPRGTQFRQWATARLSEYLVKGFTLDDERLKNPSGAGGRPGRNDPEVPDSSTAPKSHGLRQNHPVMLARAVLVAGALAGCSDDAPERCRFDAPDRVVSLASWNCANARVIAQRDGQGLAVTQAELDSYLDVYLRAFEPLAPTLGYPPLADTWWSEVAVETSRTELVTPWSAGQLSTGFAGLDMIVDAAGIDLVDKAPGVNLFHLRSLTHAPVQQNLARAINELGLADVTASTEEFHFTEPGSEITFEARPGADAVPVLFQIGWGDCFVDCDGQHFWRIVVTPTGAALTADWGDPIPPAELEGYRNAVAFPY